MGRIRIHTAYFLFHFICRIWQINTVTQRLAHLGLAVSTRQTQAGCIVRQQNFGFHQCFTVNIVEAAYDLTGLFNHRFLIFTGRNCRSLKSSNVSSLADRISKETDRNTCFEITHLYFSLHRRITLQAGYCNQVHKIEAQFIEFRNLRLDENSGLCRIQSGSQIVKSNFDHVLTHLFRVFNIVRQCLSVCLKYKNTIIKARVLKLHTTAQRTYIMSDMQFSGGTITGKDNLFFLHS